MGRYVNWLLIAIGLAAAAALAAEGILGGHILNTELSELLCVIAAVPPVIAAVRMENTRRIDANKAILTEELGSLGETFTREIRALGDNIKISVAETARAHADEMIGAVAKHADRTCQHIHERTLSVLAEAQERAKAEAMFSDTGPFRAIR